MTANVAELELASQSPLLISLASLDSQSFEAAMSHIAEAFSGSSAARNIIVTGPDFASTSAVSNGIRIVGSTPLAPATSTWTLTAADFLNAYEVVAQHGARGVLLLGGEAQSLAPNVIRGLALSILDNHADLTVPRYELPPRAGLVNSAILYPVSRALFGANPRFPLAIDLGLSARAAERLAAAAQRFTAANQPDALIWPVSEVAVAGYSIAEVDAGQRLLPQPSTPDLNSLLAHVAGSLFADVEAKAAFWQRARLAQPSVVRTHSTVSTEAGNPDEAAPMIDSFRLAYGNLHEIWSLVLPPQSLLGLKRLSILPAASFVMPDALWARVVYDFLLAFRLRTINRGHLLGALTPLYLAWVASHLLQTANGSNAELHTEAVAAAFEAEKPYVVSRWRWPDRFNP